MMHPRKVLSSSLAIVVATWLALNCIAVAQQPSQEAEVVTQPKYVTQSQCPVDGHKLPDDPEASHEDADGVRHQLHFDYEGQRVRVCSLRCLESAKGEAEFVLARMQRDGVAGQPVHAHCPITGEQLESREHVVWSANKSFAVCCKKCARKASANPAPALDALQGRSSRQSLCPVDGKKLRGRHQLEVHGYRVRICSQACLDQLAESDTGADASAHADIWNKLAKQGVVLEPIKRQCALDPSKKGELKSFVTLPGRRLYFHSAEARWQYLAPYLAPKQAEEAAGGALDFLGGSLGG